MGRARIPLDNIPKTFPLAKVIDEAKDTKSYIFKGSIDYLPGQFVMVWLPGLDAKPFSLSYHSMDEFGITAKRIGPFTTALEKLKAGDPVGFFGPYGNSFSIEKDVLIIGGGVGMASLSVLAEVNQKAAIINGAQTKDMLVFQKLFPNAAITTDDGTAGTKGFVTVALEKAIKEKKPKLVQMCGPEIMMVNVFKICQEAKIPVEASLERYMSCGFGICGKCAVGDRLVCYDGPVFTSEQLSALDEFGRSAREKTGQKVSLDQYHA